jgi:hypothetical protein
MSISSQRGVLVGIDDAPGTTGIGVIIRNTLLGSLVDGVFGVESIPVFVFGGADRSGRRHCVTLHDGVVWTVDLRVDAKTEQMLVIMRVDTWVDLSAPAMGCLTGVQNICV